MKRKIIILILISFCLFYFKDTKADNLLNKMACKKVTEIDYRIPSIYRCENLEVICYVVRERNFLQI